MGKIKDIVGQRFGRLVVIGYAEKGHYNCICEKSVTAKFNKRQTN